MTPTNEAPVTVEQCDIDRAARCFTIEGRDGDRLREHFADQFARHRLAALASAPAKCSVCGYAEVDCRARKPMTCFGRGGDDLASAPAGDGVIAVVIELARRDIAREQTDFLGRMAQSLCTYEGIFADYPDGDLPEDVRDEAEDEISALAGLALAQLVLLRHPSDGTDPAAALARPHFCGARQ